MEYIESLRWSLEDVTRVFGVPKVMIGDLENTTFSNFSTARRLFWGGHGGIATGVLPRGTSAAASAALRRTTR